MTITVSTIFPSLFEGFLSEGLVARAIQKGLVDVRILNLRDFATDSYKTVDDYPYGGGPGMVMKAEPILRAVSSVTGLDFLRDPALDRIDTGQCEARGESAPVSQPTEASADSNFDSKSTNMTDGTARASGIGTQSKPRIIILSPQGRGYNQEMANELCTCGTIILICGRYKAVDERVKETLGAEEISIGDYVLSGGELGAMVLIESVVRLMPGAMEDEGSAACDSFTEGILDCAYYTRPEVVAGKKVPDVLLSGNHQAIRKWRRKNSIARTLQRRPDLLEKAILSKEDRELLEECRKEHGF